MVGIAEVGVATSMNEVQLCVFVVGAPGVEIQPCDETRSKAAA